MAWSDKTVTPEWFVRNAANQFDVANLDDALQTASRREVLRQIIRLKRVDRLGDDVGDWFDAIADESDLDDFIEDALGFAVLYRWFVDVHAHDFHEVKAGQYRKMMVEAVEALLEYAPQVLSDSGSAKYAGSDTVTWAI